MEFVPVLVVAVVLVEAMIESVTMLFENFDWKMVASGLLGIAVSWLFGLDVFAFLGIAPVIGIPLVSQIVGLVIMGLLFVRHAGNLNDLLEFIKGLRPE
jgi:hypothetical protein